MGCDGLGQGMWKWWARVSCWVCVLVLVIKGVRMVCSLKVQGPHLPFLKIKDQTCQISKDISKDQFCHIPTI